MSVFNDTALVSCILEYYFKDAHVLIQEPRNYTVNSSRANIWTFLRGTPRIKSLLLVSKTFNKSMKFGSYDVNSIQILRPIGADPYSPLDPSIPMESLQKYLFTKGVRVPSLGNGWSDMGDRLACGIKQGMMDAECIDIECLDGFLSLEQDAISTHPVLPMAKKMRIGSVGHAGLVSRIVVEEAFQRSQKRAMARMNLNHDMTNMGSIEELIIESPLPVRVERNILPGRIEFYFSPNIQSDALPNLTVRSLTMITKKMTSHHRYVFQCTLFNVKPSTN